MIRHLLIILALTTACASDPGRRQQIISEETGRLRPTNPPLTAFGGFELLPVAWSPEVAEKPEKVEVAKQLGHDLGVRLQPLFADWTGSAPAAARGRTLVIQPTVVGLRVISGGARFWLGALSGDSFIDVDLLLTEKETGKVVAKERINKKSGAMAGAWSFGSTDQNLAGYVVDITHQYLVDNHKM